MKINDLKQGFAQRVKSHINNLDDLLSDASVKGDHREVARLFHESVVAENLLECLEGKYLNKDHADIIVYPSDAKSTPSVRRVKTRHEIGLIVGGSLELAKFNANSFSVIINGDAKKSVKLKGLGLSYTAHPNPYLPPYRGTVVMVSNDWEKLPLK
jgi:hypothetical protein